MSDLGNDSVLGAQYANEHELVMRLLHQRAAKMPSAGAGLTNAALLELPLSSYKDHLVTPAALSLRGITVRRLASAYGLSALIEYGLTWNHLVAMGLQAADLSAFSFAQLRALRVSAPNLLDLRPSASHIVGMRLTAVEFEQLGCNSPEWLHAVKYNMRSMCEHGFSLHKWSNMLGPRADWRSLGFVDMNSCKQAGWDSTELYTIIFSKLHAASLSFRMN